MCGGRKSRGDGTNDDQESCGGVPPATEQWQLGRECGRQIHATLIYLQNAFDLGVQSDVSHGFGIDDKGHAIKIVEMEKTADVVVLVIAGEKLLGLRAAQIKCRKRHRSAEITSKRAVAVDQFSQRQPGSPLGGLGGHNRSPWGECTATPSINKVF